MISPSSTTKFINRFAPSDPLVSVHDHRRLQFTAMVFIQGLIVGLVFIPVNYSVGGWPLSLYGVSFATTSIVSLYLVRRRQYQNFARLLFITIANLMILGMYHHVGHDSDVHFFFGPSISLPFLMFPKENKKSLFYSIGLPFTLLVSNYFLTIPFITPVVIPSESLDLYGFISAFLAIMMVATGFYVLYQITMEHEENLTKQSASLVHSEKMSSLGIVAAGMAHEINNPLTIIAGAAQSLRRKAKEGSIEAEQLLTHSERILQTIGRITKIMDSLKVYSRNSQRDPSGHFRLSDVLDQAQTLCQKKLFELQFTKICPPDTYVFCNDTELLQVLVNLISNACDAQEKSEKPWIRIEVSKIKNASTAFHQIRVIDSGLGIDSQLEKQLFTPFFTTKQVGQGTGLGLAISQRLLDSRNCRLYYQLYQGHTCFVIDIPMANEDREAA